MLLSTHVDDLKVTGQKEVIDQLAKYLELCFGKLKVHHNTFEHCGIMHEQDPVTFTITLSQNHYTKQ